MSAPAQQIDPRELSAVIANHWDTLAGLLGPEREDVEQRLIPLLREIEASMEGNTEAAGQQLLALFSRNPAALAALLQALRETSSRQPKAAGQRRILAERQRFTIVPVFYGTDRAREAGPKFGGGRGTLSYGVAEVSIPDDHRMGKIERPCWWRLEFRADPQKHVVIHALHEHAESAFIDEARAKLKKSAKNEVLLFVHGYRTAFDEAVMRAGQFAYDLHFEGLSAMYSWPSEASTARYMVDETNVAWSQPSFLRFLMLLRERLGARVVHVVAHSMGNRLLVELLKSLPQTAADTHASLGQVIFAAPDVDADTFQDIAASFTAKASQFTLYASSDDVALKASKAVHKYSRAGESGVDLVIVDPVHTVDATEVDTSLLGHSYYGDNRSILADIFSVIRQGDPPGERFGLMERQRYGQRYWTFRG